MVSDTISMRPTRIGDLAFVTALERAPENRGLIGQWTDVEHLAAIEGRDRREHWIIERGGERAGYLIVFDGRHEDAGIYLKRILVDHKERGTGTEALRQLIAKERASEGTGHLWLIVRADNARAQHVYRKLGFGRYHPHGEDARRHDRGGEEPAPGAFRMRLKWGPGPSLQQQRPG